MALTSFPYSAGCDTNTSSGCQVLKAAIGVDGVLWCVAREGFANASILLLCNTVMLCANKREAEVTVEMGDIRPRPYYYY